MTTLLCCLALTTAAQEPATTAEADSVMTTTVSQDSTTTTVQMKEVVVETATVYNKQDRQLFLPTSVQRRMANNGLSLLQAMQLPRIDVSLADNSITTSGGESVQLRINGVEASTQELLALQPKDIVRIEYHSMPGLRYGNAAAVLDYIVRHRDTGGDLSANATNGINMPGIGDYYAAGKVYSGRSAFSVMGNWNRRDLEWTRENTELFRLPTGDVQTTETGHPTAVRYDNAFLHLNYSLTHADRSLLSVTLRQNWNNAPASFEDRESRMETSDGKSYAVSDHTRSRQQSPSLDVYYQLNMKHNQHLYLDLVGTYIRSSNNRTFVQEPATHITSDINGRKYSVIGEAIYERELKTAKVTAGVKHTQAYTDNRYATPSDPSAETVAVALHTSETYVFAEFQQQLRRFGYTAGMGAMRTQNRQGQLSQEKYILRPSLTLTYAPVKSLFLRYNGYVSGYSPSLASLSNVTQAIDTYQSRRGNQKLRTVTFCSNSLSVSWQTKPVSIDLYMRYSYDHHPIMEEAWLDGNTIIRTEANQRGFHRFNTDLTTRVRPFCNSSSDLGKSFQLSLAPFFDRYVSQGNSYTHTYARWGLRGSLMAMYKHWIASAEMKTSRHTLWGETIEQGEATHTLMAGYRTQRWSLNLLLLNPFVRHYEQRHENLSALAPYTQLAFTDDIRRTLMVNVSVNLSYGKQHRHADKRINNDDSDAGLLKGSR